MRPAAPEAAGPRRILELDGPADWDGFRRLARWAVAAGLAPASVHWQVAGDSAADLFAASCPVQRAADLAGEPPPLNLPPAFVACARRALLHDDRQRFAALYRWVHRLAVDATAWDDPLSAERVQVERWASAVRRDVHRMHAYVRFERATGIGATAGPSATETAPGCGRGASDGSADEWLVAWYEPSHHVVEAAAPFFVRRLGTLRWVILTPRGSVRFDGHRLQSAAPADRSQRPEADHGQALWVAYYQSIFNPARVNWTAMRRDMPARFWPSLPELDWALPMARDATARTGAMLAAPPSLRRRRRAGPTVQPGTRSPG